MTDDEFDMAVQAAYDNELKRTGNKYRAHDAAERVRRALIVGRAEAAMRRKQNPAPKSTSGIEGEKAPDFNGDVTD
jgi:hypothetical protein